ncbi:probable serine/threonine-protein kinase PBL18 [Coffea arabica]|uniref:non-specific serine/threonine protein kinase n=1 Tax=Coffea arabica TaxID=13443 RepID=A0ABM4VUT8_COFAR
MSRSYDNWESWSRPPCGEKTTASLLRGPQASFPWHHYHQFPPLILLLPLAEFHLSASPAYWLGNRFHTIKFSKRQIGSVNLTSSSMVALGISFMEFWKEELKFVPLVGQCLENANEKRLVYEHMVNKDLSTSLSRKIESGNRRKLPFLDWITRLKIATEVAEAYLYYFSDIQASSLLLDDKFEVKLGSLYEVCAEEKDMRQTATSEKEISAMAFGEGTFAAAPTTSLLQDIKRASVIWDQEAGRYVSVPVPASDTRGRSFVPEGSKTSTGLKNDDKRPVTFLSPGTSNDSYASCAYDVYSFGKVLLELVTGKLGLTATDDSALNGWMENVLSYILPDDVEVVVNIIDSSLVRAKHLLAQAWAVSFIAKACLSPESSERPRMAQIHLALEHIESASFTNKNLNFTGNHDSVRSAAMEIAKILWGCKIGRQHGQLLLEQLWAEALPQGTIESQKLVTLRRPIQRGGSSLSPI